MSRALSPRPVVLGVRVNVRRPRSERKGGATPDAPPRLPHGCPPPELDCEFRSEGAVRRAGEGGQAGMAPPTRAYQAETAERRGAPLRSKPKLEV